MRTVARNVAACLVGVFALGALLPLAGANPWIAPGDEGLRHDLQLLADEGVIDAPLLTWPIVWADVLRALPDVEQVPVEGAIGDAVRRVRSRGSHAAQLGWRTGETYAAFGKPSALRGFASAPRGKQELGSELSWLGENFALKLNATAVRGDAIDKQTFRFDGSYVAARLGNIGVSAGLLERWWGPGWDGSLIAGTNARPFPSIRIERLVSTPFETPLLRWIGPWKLSAEYGQFERSGLPVSDVRFFGMRFEMRPLSWVQIGLSRTSQWCGTGQPCGGDAFVRMLTGKDSEPNAEGVAQVPGNQLAGYDLRLQSPWKAVPLAVYGQLIGEDESGGLPSRFVGLAGAEYWGAIRSLSYRLRFEYAETACGALTSTPTVVDCAYENSRYPQGYRYRSAGLGHSLDRDGRISAVGLILGASGGQVFSMRWAHANINRGGGPHPLVTNSRQAQWQQWQLRADLPSCYGLLRGQLALQSPTGGSKADQLTGFIEWRKSFQ